jgi:two-component system sensor histidine kinase PilS (NtrC family)
MEALRRKLVWLVVSRASILGVLFLVTVFVGRGSPYVWPVSLLALIVSALSFLYVIALQAGISPNTLIRLQLGNDVLLATWLVYRTGDVESPFNALYLVIVFAASLLSSRRGIFVITLLTISFDSAMSGCVLAGLLPRGEGFGAYPADALAPVQFDFAFTIVAILAVSVLSSNLAGRQRQSDMELADATRRLGDLRAFNERVIESMRSGLITTDLMGHIVSVNRAAEEIIRRSGSELNGQPLDSLFPDIAALTFQDNGDGLRLPRTVRSEAPYVRGDGVELHLGFNAAPLVADDGEVTGLVVIFQDLTEVIELEREVRRQEKLAALGTMAAGLAHEIRNPLASMRGSVQILAGELSLDEDQKRLMQIVLRESDRLNRTVTDFLAYARPAPYSPVRFDIRRAVSESVALLRNSSELGADQRLEESLPDGPVYVTGDPNRLRQIFWNLARNGLQAMPRGGCLFVRVEPGADGATLEIEDQGEGMSKEQVDALYMPFSPSSRGGTGLGMAIVYQLVQDQGGRIHVTTTPGVGTRVSVWLPATPAS